MRKDLASAMMPSVPAAPRSAAARIGESSGMTPFIGKVRYSWCEGERDLVHRGHRAERGIGLAAVPSIRRRAATIRTT